MRRALFLCTLLLGLVACDSGGDLVTLRVSDEVTVETTGDAFTYYALAASLNTTGTVIRTVPGVIPVADADTSIRWDLAFRGTEILLNSGSSGPGAAVGVFVDTAFADVDTIGAPSATTGAVT